MSRSGRPAARPAPGWRPDTRRDGLRIEFISEDGKQRKTFDFSQLEGRSEIQEEFADAFIAATGPLGTWKRLASAMNLWDVTRHAARCLAINRPGLSSLGRLSLADARLLAIHLRVPSGYRRLGVLRGLLRYSPVVSGKVIDHWKQFHQRQTSARQPYSRQEFDWITTAARGIVRRARLRLHVHWRMVDEFQAGNFDHLGRYDPQRSLAEALDHCARTGDIPRSPTTGKPHKLNDRAVKAAGGRSLATLLHLTGGEAFAFAMLLASTTGLNQSTLAEMPAPHLQAATGDEPGFALVNAYKPRRGSRSRMTLPLSALRPELQPAGRDVRPQHVRNTSLSTAYGVFRLLTELTEPARQVLSSDRAFIYFASRQPGHRMIEGLPNTPENQRRRWVREVLTGDEVRDRVLVAMSLDRMRKTFLEQHRRPVAHTPATLAAYLRRMDTVTVEGFHIVHEALDEQVNHALARRRMTVKPTEDSHDDPTGNDTVLGSCSDFDHSPLDDGRACQQSFLSCLDCSNARALPRHLSYQLAVLDELQAKQATVPIDRWVHEFAGRVAQLQDITEEFTPAQRQQARAHITDVHRRIAARLLAGELDPL